MNDQHHCNVCIYTLNSFGERHDWLYWSALIFLKHWMLRIRGDSKFPGPHCLIVNVDWQILWKSWIPSWIWISTHNVDGQNDIRSLWVREALCKCQLKFIWSSRSHYILLIKLIGLVGLSITISTSSLVFSVF